MRQTLSPWVDGSYNLGTASNKWAALFATIGTIQTSDENEKQQIASLTSAEITAATAISKLFKTYCCRKNKTKILFCRLFYHTRYF